MGDVTINKVMNDMTIGEILIGIKNEVMDLLNSSAFSTDSIEGWIVIFLCLVIVYKVTKEAYDFIGWCVGVLFLIQLGYCLSLTGLNDLIPLSDIFKYNVVVSVAQCFVGTPFCDLLLYVDAFISYIGNVLWNFLEQVLPVLKRLVDSVMR